MCCGWCLEFEVSVVFLFCLCVEFKFHVYMYCLKIIRYLYCTITIICLYIYEKHISRVVSWQFINWLPTLHSMTWLGSLNPKNLKANIQIPSVMITLIILQHQDETSESESVTIMENFYSQRMKIYFMGWTIYISPWSLTVLPLKSPPPNRYWTRGLQWFPWPSLFCWGIQTCSVADFVHSRWWCVVQNSKSTKKKNKLTNLIL